MVASDIRESSVLAAIAEYDNLGQDEFLRRYNFGKASKFRLVHQGKFYDSKAIAGVAHGFATNDFWTTARPFGGVGPGGAVPILEDLGFLVDRTGLLFELTKLKVDQTHGKPAPYQYVVLLWAIAHAHEGARRLIPFGDVRRDLSQLLAPFAIARTAPDPAMPWAALGNSAWWERDNRGTLGGLSQPAFWTVAQDEAFRAAAVEVIVQIISDSEEMRGLLVQLGLAAQQGEGQFETDTPKLPILSDTPEVSDAVAAQEELSNPRRKFGRSLSAAENKAIEQRAVAVVREHLETELGFLTEDVGATESYDVKATRGKDIVKVEVKGTTTSGAAVVLTRNEVKLHLAEYPKNALAIVRKITLKRDGDEPVATGGELVLTMPWEIDASFLSPIAYEYRTGLQT